MSTLTLQLDVRTCRHKLASYYGNTRTLMACSSASSCIRTAIYNTHLAAYQQKLALVSVSERSVGSNSRLAPAATTGQGEGYTTLAQPVQYEEEVKKSRFLVKAWPVQSGVEAQQRIKAASDPRCACVACIHSGLPNLGFLLLCYMAHASPPVALRVPLSSFKANIGFSSVGAPCMPAAPPTTVLRGTSALLTAAAVTMVSRQALQAGLSCQP